MPTSPAQPERFSAGESHLARQMAESFGTDPERYDRARPRYPQPMVDAVLAAVPGRDLLDVGIGTGISAQLFVAAGCRVLGVDVDPRMAEFARRRGFDVEVAKWEEWDPAGRTFDAVIAGQTWHWIDPVAGAAKAAKVLRPGGRLAVFWNIFQTPPDLAEAFAAVHRRVLPDSPFFRNAAPGLASYDGLLTKATEGMRSSGAFAEPEQWRFEWEHRYTKEEWLDQVPTGGIHNRLPSGQLDELLAGIGQVIDAAGGSFTMRYTTAVVTAPTADRPHSGA